MATSNLKKRTGANINDIIRKNGGLLSPARKPLKTPPRATVTPIPTVHKVEVKEAPVPLKKLTDIADKKTKSIFRHLDVTGIEQPDKLLEFVRWYSLPRQLRRPETQEKLSEKIGIHKDTFANWKRRAGFWAEVDVYTNSYFRSHAPDIYYALVQYGKKTGDPRAVKLYAQLFQGWSEKVRTQDETPESPLDEELKKQITHAIHNIGLSVIKQGYEEDEEDKTLSTENNE